MKKSRYNKFWTNEDGVKLAFNAMTCALAEIDDDFVNMLEKIETVDYKALEGADKELVDAMLEGNFIVHDFVDELKMVKFRNYAGKFSQKELGLTIAPTLSCNFACPYCYESPHNHKMSEDIQNSIVELVEDAAKHKKKVSITWYGGEPLITKDLIFELSEKFISLCDKYEADYGAYMVTNGYLIDDQVIEGLKKSKIRGAQITIDGPPHIHNQRRILKGKNPETFDTIIENIRKMRKNDLHVNIRVNIDKTNIDYLEDLLDILDAEGLKDVPIGLGHVTAYTDSCTSIVETCMNTEEYANNNLKYQKILHSKGFDSEGYPYYPGVKANYCCADSMSAYVIDPEGFMYKCWNDVGNHDKAVSNVLNFKDEIPEESMYMRNIDYVMWSPFEHEECVECDLLPICMGGCPYNGSRQGYKPECEKWKYNLEEVLKFTYVQKSEHPCDSKECNGCK